MFKKSDNLWYFDVYPKVFTAGKESKINIRPLGGREVFKSETEYIFKICSLDGGKPWDFPSTGDFKEFTLKSDSNSCFEFLHTFASEQEYFIRAYDEDNKKIFQTSVYCVEKDLSGRYPFIGDLHMHTLGSDGRQSDEVVCANYRRTGYDFTVISDHRRYYPSIHAMNFYKDIPTEFTIIPGEEVHMPRTNGKYNDVHIVNFGGEYSVNSLVEGEATQVDGTDLSVRAIRSENVPDVMTLEEYGNLMDKLENEIDVPAGVDAYPAAVCKWVFDNIKNANGLGIFAHPNWRSDVNQIPERFTDYLFNTKPFDAFEVLGGENYFEQNGYQTVRYYEECAKGNKVPIVGSTDSHSSLESNENSRICSTIIFSDENERLALIDSVKKFYSVAVDTISEEFRLVGDSRFVHYGCFLLKNYFPLHDELCYEEGRLMHQYATGSQNEKSEAVRILSIINGRMKAHREKYFDF